MFCCGGGVGLHSLSSDSSGQLDVFGHYCDPLGMDGTQVGVLEQADQIQLCCLLKTHYGCQLEPQVCLEILSDLPHEPLKRQLTDEECCALLKVTNVFECCCSGPVSVWLNLSSLQPCLVHFVELPLHPI